MAEGGGRASIRTPDGSPLGLIAGGGTLPRQIITQCQADGRPVFVLGFHGHTDPETTDAVDHAHVALGRIGAAVDALKTAGVRDIVMAGAIRRPNWSDLDLDRRGAKLLLKLGMRGRGDDALLRILIAELEGEGFRVLSVPDVLSDRVMPPGIQTRARPDQQAQADIARGVEVLTLIGAADIGQAAVIQQGLVLAVEAIEGTDAMLSRCRGLARPGAGGVLVKMRKPGQEDRADLPTVGPGTVAAAVAAGLRGVAVEAAGALAIALDEMVAAADRADIFLVGIPADRPAGPP